MTLNTERDAAARSTFMEISPSPPDTGDGLFGRGEITIDRWIFTTLKSISTHIFFAGFRSQTLPPSGISVET